MINFRWFISHKVRQATAMRKHVHRILCAQRDILAPQAVTAVADGLTEMAKAIRSHSSAEALQKEMEKLESIANKWLKPYPNATYRENVEVLLVALAVAMGIRTFFVQPFKIPTGSMEPTLFGVESVNYIRDPNIQFPTGFARFKEWIHGVSYLHVKAEADGQVEIRPPLKFLIFNIKQSIRIGDHWQTIWFPPDYGAPPAGSLDYRAGLGDGQGRFTSQTFRKGDDVVKLKVMAGDYLFVDRVTFNFRKPTRGEIIVFETAGVETPIGPWTSRGPEWVVDTNTFYIKRLVGLGNETLKIGDDQHLVIDGKRLDAATPHFEGVYSFKPNAGDFEYFGHTPIKRFANGAEVKLAPDHLMVMGDNTQHSLDSRFFGSIDEKYVIGKSWFVYWPVTTRFGLGYR